MLNKKINRKAFLQKSTLIGLAGSSLLASCKSEEKSLTNTTIDFSKKYKWKMVTTWPPNFPVVGEGASLFAKWVEEMSGGRIVINVYGGGELVPALEVFDAVSSGASEMGSGASYYWAGKNPALQLFTTVPFGMNAQQMNSWLYCGGGLALWEEMYAKYNLVPFPGGNTGVQMGGWFNKEINTIEDFKGLKMRMPGLGGKVLNMVGSTAVLSAGSELYTNLERGVIDATEWIGPYHDYLMGFHEIAKYYYTPGWHETGSNLEIIINKRLYDSLPKDLQSILQTAAYRLNIWALSEFEAKNNQYLQKIIKENKVEIRAFPLEVLHELKFMADKVLSDLAASNKDFNKVYTSYKAFHSDISQWSSNAEAAYFKMMG